MYSNDKPVGSVEFVCSGVHLLKTFGLAHKLKLSSQSCLLLSNLDVSRGEENVQGLARQVENQPMHYTVKLQLIHAQRAVIIVAIETLPH